MKKLLRTSFRCIKKPVVWLSHLLGGEVAARRRRAARLARTMRSELTRLGFWERTKKGKKKVVQYEEPLLMTKDELWAPINLAQFPHRRTTNDLRDSDVLDSLKDRCHATVRVDKLANGKLCLVTRLRPTQFPSSYSINAFQMAPDAPLLAFPLGIDVDGEHCYADLEDVKHLLVCGATGGGKSTFLHTMLYTWATRCSADEVELWLIDLKNGAEFGTYEALHAKKKNSLVRHMAYEAEPAVETLNRAFQEIQKRNREMKKHGAGDVRELSHLSGTRYRQIVVVVDEIHMLTLDKETKIGKTSVANYSTYYIAKIAALGRAAGVHIVIATQSINKEVLVGMIRANFENRVSFSCADWRQSQLILETSDAVGLPVGRMFFRKEGETAEFQAPLITKQQRRLEINRVAQHGPEGGLGTQDELSRFIRDAKLIIKVACEQFDGACAVGKLTQAEGIRGVISKDILVEHLQRLERDGVLEPGGSHKPRKVARGFFGMAELLDARYGHIAGQDDQDDWDEDSQDEEQYVQDEAEQSSERTRTNEVHSGGTSLRLDRPEGQDEPPIKHKVRSTFAKKRHMQAHEEAARIEAQIDQVVDDIGGLLAENPDLSDEIPAPFRHLFATPARESVPAQRRPAPRNLFAKQEDQE